MQTLYMVIHSVKMKQKTRHGVQINVFCKNFQVLEYIVPREVDAIHICESMKHFSFPGTWACPPGAGAGAAANRRAAPRAVRVAAGTNQPDTAGSSVFAEKVEDLYAFQYRPDYDSEIDGWQFYDAQTECVAGRHGTSCWDASLSVRGSFRCEL